MNLDHWNSKDFLTFVLLHMAKADNEISLSELYHLASRLGPERVMAMRTYIEKLDVNQQTKLITRSRDRFYPGAFGKSSLIAEICELCEADGEFSNNEQAILAHLQKVL